jgi:hypothetical protein
MLELGRFFLRIVKPSGRNPAFRQCSVEGLVVHEFATGTIEPYGRGPHHSETSKLRK